MMLSGEDEALRIDVLPQRLRGAVFSHFQGSPSKTVMKIKAENTPHIGYDTILIGKEVRIFRSSVLPPNSG